MQNQAKKNIRLQKTIAIISLLLFVAKMYAYYHTRSVAILTDALESIVNIVAGFLAIYSLTISAKPRDADHPYGHGKVEFITAAVEGTLIMVAGLFIIYEAVVTLREPIKIEKLNIGLLILIISAIINYAAGAWSLRRGKKVNSLALISSGKHLKSDTYTTAGIVVGLIALYLTEIWWIDSVVAILFALIIMRTGLQIIRTSVGGIMDEADEQLLASLVETLNKKRRINWIDLHNVRIIKYGAILHVDCHLTVPWYFNVSEAHEEVDELSALVKEEYGKAVELFVHSDDCKPFSCPICHKEGCPVRKVEFKKSIWWTPGNIRINEKHSLKT